MHPGGRLKREFISSFKPTPDLGIGQVPALRWRASTRNGVRFGYLLQN
jgi:hypothetical protein